MKRLAFALGAVLLGLAGACLVCEIVLRLTGVRPERYELPRWYVLHEGEYKHWGKLGRGHIKRPGPYTSLGVGMGEYVPGATFKVVFDTNPRGYFDEDNGVVMQVNELGLRGPSVSPDKPHGVTRILGLGDSFTFGSGVRDADTFLRRLELALNRSPGRPGDGYEVLNAGVQGYSTRDEVLYLEQRWLALQPDLVLIVFYVNDAYSDAALLNMGEELGIYRQPTGLARQSRLLDLVQHRLQVRRIGRETERYYNRAYFSDPGGALQGAERGDWDASRRALRRAVRLARERDVGLGLVLFPELHRLRGDYPFEAIHALVLQTCEELGLPALDLMETFRGRDERQLWVHPSDHHPNEIAHGISAGPLEEFVRALLEERSR